MALEIALQPINCNLVRLLNRRAGMGNVLAVELRPTLDEVVSALIAVSFRSRQAKPFAVGLKFLRFAVSRLPDIERHLRPSGNCVPVKHLQLRLDFNALCGVVMIEMLDLGPEHTVHLVLAGPLVEKPKTDRNMAAREGVDQVQFYDKMKATGQPLMSAAGNAIADSPHILFSNLHIDWVR